VFVEDPGDQLRLGMPATVRLASASNGGGAPTANAPASAAAQ